MKLKNLLFPALFFFAFTSVKAQQYTLTGIVFSADSLKPLPFATVSAGNAKAVMANERGVFQLSVRVNDTLEVSAIGFLSKKIQIIAVDSGNIQKIFLDKKVYQLNEVKIQGIKTPADLKQAILNMPMENEDVVVPGTKQYKGPLDPVKPTVMSPISAILESKWAKKKRVKKWNKKTDIPKMR